LHKALEIAVEKEFVTRDDSLEILRSAISENCDPFKMTLRQYLNLHARWGGRRAKRDGLPRANQRIAAHHHSLNREQDNSEPESPEDTAKLVELLEIGDKAVAHMFRSHEQWRSSESVIASIRESIEECTDTLVRNAALTLMNRYNTLFIEALDTIKEARARVKRVGETSTNPRKSP
ncbi:hypothetical protein KKG51_04015, partial [Patescibacteria group bacterium]|nr:hypothetical protein [Patescibacteria group bacterium]